MTPTDQIVYNKVKAHLLNQKVRCVSEQGNCRYRNAEGQKCAAGSLIPDYLYSPAMENRTWNSAVSQYPDLLTLGNPELIQQLQALHDRQDPKKWAKELEALALKRGLIP